MSDYVQLMMREQAEARRMYSYDPRQIFSRQSNAISNVEAFNSTRPTNIPTVEGDYTGIPEGSRSDPQIVQETPKTKTMKRYVIVDANVQRRLQEHAQMRRQCRPPDRRVKMQV